MAERQAHPLQPRRAGNRGGKLREELALLALSARVRADRLRHRAAPLDDEPEVAAVGNATRVGTLLSGRYRIEALLGSGGFGRVWRAEDKEEKRTVAIKELLDAGADNPEQFHEFEQEFFTLSQLRHRHIVGALDYGRTAAGARFLVMELVEGQDLSERIARGPLPAKEAARVLYELMLGLELLHSRLFVHCDIKAENLRLTKAGAKLMDFGLLHQLGTPVTQVKGTPLYMAPEMLQGGVIDARTDFYSVGVLAYEAFTGNPPFVGTTPAEIIRAHLEVTPRPPSYFLDLPPAIDQLILKLLAKDAAQRPREASELLLPLAELAGVTRGEDETLARTGYLYAADLVGRDAERATLADLHKGLAEGRGGSVAIAGRGGEGKTRLLEELKLKAKIDGMHWLVGQCRPELAPMQPMIDALSPLVSDTSEEELARFGPALSFVLPSVAARGFKFEGSPDPNVTRVTVFAAISDWLAAIAARRRVVLCLEDVHWADGASVDLFNALVRRRGDAPVGLLVTFRSNELDPSHAAYTPIHDGTTQLLPLAPLSRNDVDTLLTCSIRDHALPPGFVDRLFAASEGNPFFMIESLRALVETGVLERKGGIWQVTDAQFAFPRDIGEVVARRVGVLPPDLRATCEALAPIGRFLDLAPVLSVTQLDARAAHDKMTALVERQFLLRERGRYLFSHDQVRAALYGTLADDRRRTLHQRIAETVASAASAEPATVAYHYKRGETPQRSVDLFLTAARKSLAKQQQAEAIRLLSEGLDVIGTVPAKTRRTLEVTILEILGRISTLVQPRVGVAAVDRLVDLWRKEIDLEGAAIRLRQGPSAVARLAARLRPRPAAAATDFDPSSRDPRVVLPKLLELRGQEAYGLTAYGEVKRAAELLDEIERLMPSPEHPLRFSILQSRTLASFHRGRFEEVRRYAEQVCALVDALPAAPPPPVTFAYFVTCYLRGLAEAWGGYEITPSFEERNRQTAERTKSTMFAAYVVLPRFVEAIERGAADVAEPLAVQMEVFLQQLGFPELGITRLRIANAYFHACRGASVLAKAHGRAVLRIAERSQDRWLVIYQSIFLAINAAEQAMESRAPDALRAADAQLARAIDDAAAADAGRLPIALAWRVEVQRMLGDVAGAKESSALLERRAQDPATGCARVRVAALRASGTVTDGAAGLNLLGRALDLARDIQNPFEEMMTAYRIAEFQLAAPSAGARERGAADEMLLRAAALADQIRNPLWQRRIAQLRAGPGGHTAASAARAGAP